LVRDDAPIQGFSQWQVGLLRMSALLLVPHALPLRECASPDERLLKDEGTQRQPHCLPLVPRRPQRVKRLLEPLCTPPNRSAAERQCVCRPQRKPVLHRWRREGACQQDDSVRRSTAPCAHSRPRSPRSHEVRVRSAQSCLTRLARLNLAAGRQSARRTRPVQVRQAVPMVFASGWRVTGQERQPKAAWRMLIALVGYGGRAGLSGSGTRCWTAAFYQSSCGAGMPSFAA